jgi:hypothetical protein
MICPQTRGFWSCFTGVYRSVPFQSTGRQHCAQQTTAPGGREQEGATMISHRLSRSAALALALAAFAAPAATAQQDLRSPDAKDAASAPEGQSSVVQQDLRSPDVRDYAEGRGTFNAPEVTVVKVPVDRAQPATGRLDWADAGIGAAIMLGLVLLGFGGAFAVVRRRHTVAGPHAATTA